jgi:hypothetical protein
MIESYLHDELAENHTILEISLPGQSPVRDASRFHWVHSLQGCYL